MQGPVLSEKDFIQEGYKKNPFPFWLCLFLFTALVAISWGVSNWYNGKINLLMRDSPFLQVTNREMSLFLWQNPEFMRINVKDKRNYLPAFQYTDKVTIDVANADQYVVAPPELLFRYHTWIRLLMDEFTERPVPLKEFKEFLSYAEEWHPNYWVNAPAGYIQMVKNLPNILSDGKQTDDLAKLSVDEFPVVVRMAFQGWMNYFKEGEAINSLEITTKQMTDFLQGHAHYARNYWQNIVLDTPDYLKNWQDKGKGVVPKNEISSFLRVAVFNYLKAEDAKTHRKLEENFE